MILIKPYYEIITKVDHSMLLNIERAGRVCYKSEDKITDGSAELLIKKIIKSGHESVLEHQSITVKFCVDRGVSHELVRHRLCSFSQESTRYVNYSKKGVYFIIPPWVDIEPGTYDLSMKYPANISITDMAWLYWMLNTEHHYNSCINLGWLPQQARSILPNSLKAELFMTANLREWRHIFKLRTAKSAHPQMREVMIPLLTELKQYYPCVFEDIGVN